MTETEQYKVLSTAVETLQKQGGAVVALTPDDILTLRLLRDELSRYTHGNWKTYEDDRRLETLERILKQVG